MEVDDIIKLTAIFLKGPVHDWARHNVVYLMHQQCKITLSGDNHF